jgi:hypothetical protein
MEEVSSPLKIETEYVPDYLALTGRVFGFD